MDPEKKFELLSNIMRASHFEWRRAAVKLSPALTPLDLVKQYWEEVGKDTAVYYLKKIDPEKDLAEQFAQLFVSSSVAMGENAEVIEKSDEGQVQACHHDCPWFHWHKKENILHEDQPGCDHWIKTVVDEINATLHRSLRFETVESLPEGSNRCLRKFWEEKK